ncbi:efflux transporter outer membrane subunit [Ideonella livida]|uniref:Efflux transporter outer membrane subunit n=1 Tax=Ideonella livida TaxID=2707176 RepID=A0A7C9PGZ7_9BURK|nr:efflux transporter outer membrane subunit [Ideonella livida]NDY91675.1 efflux transporter outer membrane subunit [Ideonella livida]
MPHRLARAVLGLGLGAGLCVGLGACAVKGATAAAPGPAPSATAATPAPVGPAQLPPAWAQAGELPGTAPDAEALARWWRLLDDARLDRLMQRALAHNSTLAQAQASLRQAQAVRRATEASQAPAVSASAGYSRSRSAGSTVPRAEAGLSAGWSPDLNGAQAAARRAAEADESAALADVDTARMTLAAQVGLAYLGWCDARLREELQRRYAESLGQTLVLTRWRAQAGLDSVLTLEQARLAAEQALAALPLLAIEAAQAEHQLAALTGQTPGAVQALLAGPAGWPDERAALQGLATGVPADLLRRRPDLRAAEAAVQAQWARRDQTRREGWPGLSLSGSLGFQALSLGALGGAGTGVAALAATISGPLWDHGQRDALVAQQDAALDLSRLQYEAAVRTALQEVEDALVALRGHSVRLEPLARAADAAEALAQTTRQQREAGLVALTDQLSAERSLQSALLNLQAGRALRTQALVTLYQVLGGGWAPDVAAPGAPPASAPASSPATAVQDHATRS